MLLCRELLGAIYSTKTNKIHHTRQPNVCHQFQQGRLLHLRRRFRYRPQQGRWDSHQRSGRPNWLDDREEPNPPRRPPQHAWWCEIESDAFRGQDGSRGRQSHHLVTHTIEYYSVNTAELETPRFRFL
jgi:hypothetical protein